MIVGCIAVDYYDYCDRKPVDFGAVSVSRVLRFVQSVGLQNAGTKGQRKIPKAVGVNESLPCLP